MSALPTIKMKSNRRRLFALVAFTFLVGTMFTILNYNQNMVQQRFVIIDNDRTDRSSKLTYNVHKLINSSKKLSTPTPIQSDKLVNLTANTNRKLPQKQSKLIKQNPVANKPIRKLIRFLHSEAELNLTQQFVIDKKNYCDKYHGYGPDLLVMVMSSPTNFDARNAIRQTWGGFAVERGSKLLFLIGRSPSTEINERLKQEDNQYEDILQGQFQDAYHNLTLKSIAMINWVSKNCEKARYVLKIDDDVFANMQLLVDFAETKEFKNAIIGKIHQKTMPIRYPDSKWYVPFTAYPDQYYPDYAVGQAYLIHREAIPNLINVIKSNSVKVLYMEDVFLTGMVAEKAGVRRVHNPLFKIFRIEVTKCNFSKLMTNHLYSPKEIIKYWDLVYSDKKSDC